MADRQNDAFEEQLRAALKPPDPDPAFVRRLETRLRRERAARSRPPRLNFRGLAQAAAALLVIVTLAGAAAWMVRYLRPGAPAAAPLPQPPTATPSPTSAPLPGALSTPQVRMLPTFTAIPVSPTPLNSLTMPAYPGPFSPPQISSASPSPEPYPGLPTRTEPAAQLPTPDYAATKYPATALRIDPTYAHSTLQFIWDGGEAAAQAGPFRGEIYADGELLGRVDFGETGLAGWCDRSFDGQVLAYSYNDRLRYFKLPQVEMVFEPFGDNLFLQSPLTFAPGSYSLAFNACSVEGRCGLYLYQLDQAELRQLSSDHFWLPPAWSPDGTQVAVLIAADEPQNLLAQRVRVYDTVTGVLIYDGDLDGVDSPIQGGVIPEFEFNGEPRCVEPRAK